MKVLLILISILHLTFGEIIEEDNTKPPLLVKTEYGLVQGTTLEAWNNETVSAFLGVPYAQAPLNELRFKPPKDHSKWNGIWKANRQPPSCMQKQTDIFSDFKGKKN